MTTRKHTWPVGLKYNLSQTGPTTSLGLRAQQLVRWTISLIILSGTFIPIGTLIGASRAAADPTVASDQAQVQQITAAINADNQKLNGLDESYNEAQIKVAQDTTQVNQAKAQLQVSQKQESSTLSTLRREAVSAYIQGGHLASLAALVDGTGNNMAVRGYYVNQATDNAQQTINQLKNQQQEISRQQAVVQAALNVDRQDLSQVAADRQAAESTISNETAQRNQIQGNLLTIYRQEQAAAAAAAVAAAAEAAAKSASQPPIVVSGPVPPPNQRAGVAVQAALSQQGKPYIWGGAGPDGYDCSGLVMFAWGQAGVGLAHGSIAQYYETTRISQSQLEPGDLVFYSPPGDPPLGHVAMYIGAGQVVEANTQGTNVGVFSMYYVGDPVGYGRVS